MRRTLNIQCNKIFIYKVNKLTQPSEWEAKRDKQKAQLTVTHIKYTLLQNGFDQSVIIMKWFINTQWLFYTVSLIFVWNVIHI